MTDSLNRELAKKRDCPDSVKYLEVISELYPWKSSAWRRRVSAKTSEAFWMGVLKNYSLQRTPSLRRRRCTSVIHQRMM